VSNGMTKQQAFDAPLPDWITDSIVDVRSVKMVNGIPSRDSAPRGRKPKDGDSAANMVAAATALAAPAINMSNQLFELLQSSHFGSPRSKRSHSPTDEDRSVRRRFASSPSYTVDNHQNSQIGTGTARPSPEPARPMSPIPTPEQELDWFARDCRETLQIPLTAELLREQGVRIEYLASGRVRPGILVDYMMLKGCEAGVMLHYAEEWHARLLAKRAALWQSIEEAPLSIGIDGADVEQTST
jgi:hypothetical protein